MKLWNMKSTFLIIFVWIVLFIINKNINIVPVLCGKGISNINGEYYRFITGALIHVNFIHLLVNCVALYCIGYYLEKYIGSGKFFIFGIVGCIMSEVIFLSIASKAESSIGGSVIIFAFIGLIVVLKRLKPELERLKLGTLYGNYIIYYGILSNIPFLSFMDKSTIVVHAIAFGVGILLGGIFSYTL